jgi:hypothetical protein
MPAPHPDKNKKIQQVAGKVASQREQVNWSIRTHVAQKLACGVIAQKCAKYVRTFGDPTLRPSITRVRQAHP